ncbi:MAG: asparagine synthase-related protein, partial [Actinomycetota bacterium]|nr:asparagine synthase-related protein [Actinomycetota bacterium]
ADQLARAADRIRTVADIDRSAASSVGSFHLLASVNGRVRVQGTVTGLQRVFHATVKGVTVAADRADVLAWLLDAAVDEQRLALHLLNPPALYPLAGQPVWRGVEDLPTDHYLVLDGDGRQRSVKWWSPPEPVVPMADGALALREALSTAVNARIRDHQLVSSDLGGLDSTALCCLAAQGPAHVVAYTFAAQDPLADDAAWARRTVAALGNVEHYILPAEEMPLSYDGLVAMTDRLDEPCFVAIDRNTWLAIGRRAAARGSRLHLTGFGGDELLYGAPAHLHTMLRTHPRIALRHVRGFTAKYRWPRAEVMRQLLDNRSYRAWLGWVADNLTAPPVPDEAPLLGWGISPRLPAWVTSAAVEAVRDLIHAQTRTVEPLAPGRGQHRELEGMRAVCRLTRQIAQMAAQMGLTLVTPYYDDRVIEAGLAVRPEDRITPWRYKPLIVEAMRGIVPEESLTRSTKANFDYAGHAGQHEHRAQLLSLCEDSRLAKLGLIDSNAFRAVCSGPLPSDALIRQTMACEVWLRTLEGARVAS